MAFSSDPKRSYVPSDPFDYSIVQKKMEKNIQTLSALEAVIHVDSTALRVNVPEVMT